MEPGLFGAGEWWRGKRIWPRINTNSRDFSPDFSRRGGLIASSSGLLALALLAQVSLCCGAGQGTSVFAAETGLVAVEEMEDLGFVGEGAEGAGEVGDWGFAVVRRVSVLICSGLIYCSPASAGFLDVFGLFDAPEAHATPLGYGHDFGLVVFDPGFGLEFGFERDEQRTEAGFGFAFEDERIGEEAVTGGVLRDAEFALGRDRPRGMDGVERRDAFSLVRDRTAGFGAVCARGGDAKF